MTSGTFRPVLISSIIIDRPNRQRRVLPDITDLKDSIRRLGLIHPIVIDSENRLVAGECRLTACTELGWTHINTQSVEDLSPAALAEIELEENIKRNDLPWEDQCRAVKQYHELRSANETEWSSEKTAEALGITRRHTDRLLAVSRALAEGNKLVAAAPRLSTAIGIVQRAESRKADAELESIGATSGPKDEPESPIECADFLQWTTTYDGPKFNFIHCDFPYGINADKFRQGAAATHGGYTDSEDHYWNLCAALAANLDRIAQPSCHFMFWYSMHYHQQTIDFFTKHTDIEFDPFPLIWMKSDNVGILPDPQRGPRRIYETCLFGSRGDRKIVRPAANAVSHPSERTSHMSIKPQTMLSSFFRMFVDESTAFLDPTCGSGSSVRAAMAGGARLVRGLEVNPEFAKQAKIDFAKMEKERAGRKD